MGGTPNMVNELESTFRIMAGPNPWTPRIGAAILMATDEEGEITCLVSLRTDGEGNVLQQDQ
jgi:hypothetical protein